MKVGIRCYVSGLVQGVSYRAATRRQAQVLDITGYARNLPDGRVEVLALGEETAVHTFREWLWQGSPWSRVSNVHWETIAFQDRNGFTVE